MDASELEARWRGVVAGLASACEAVGRAPQSVTLLAVSKYHPDAAVEALYALGQRDFGENTVQGWAGRAERLAHLSEARWHLIGPVQTNKAKFVARGRPALLHTLDRLKVVDALERRLELEADPRPLPCLIQVDIDQERSKHGCAVEALPELAARVARSPRLSLRGLMCIPRPPALGGDPRDAFARMRAALAGISDQLDTAPGPPELSMGMSGDYADAVAEGATIVRVGSAIFGPRAQP